MLPRATGKLAALIATAAVALVVLWFALLRPTIRSAAQEAATATQEAARQPFTQRLVVAAPAGETETATFVVPEDQIIEITDLVFESRGDVGRVRLLRDDEELITLQSENFRTLDQHFVSPLTFTEGEEIVYEVRCATPVDPAPTCDTAVFLNGTSKPEPPPPPPPAAPLPPAGAPAPEPAPAAPSVPPGP